MIGDNIKSLKSQVPPGVRLIAVSKKQSVESIYEAYNNGIRDFGENKVQELLNKYLQLPEDINWHLIGHLQTNKVKQIVPFVSLIHSIDSLRLLSEVNNQARKINRTVDCLLQIYIAQEETKFGLSFDEANSILSSKQFQAMTYIRITGLMGMATFTDDLDLVTREFKSLKLIFDDIKYQYFNEKDYFKELSIGMSGDFHQAIECGSTMIRIGTAIFGDRY